jgi:putative membrane protein
MMALKNIISKKEFPYTCMRFYLVGLLLYIIPYSRPVFFFLIPWVIVGSLVVMLVYHKKWDFKNIGVFLSIYILATGIEVAGIANSRLFGSYHYISSLGFEVHQTPILIGLNWLMLSYGANALAGKILRSFFFKIMLGALLMVFYDIIVEFVAPEIRMWEFDTAYPPFRNFVSWFITSLLFQLLLALFKIKTDNVYARILFIAQLGFFAVLTFYIELIQ